MPRRAFAVLTLLAALTLGCGGGAGGDGTPTAAPTATAVATEPPAGTATPALDIRQEDLSQQPGLGDFLAGSGGEVAANSITYVDLTGDGVEEAVVPVSSGGEGGNIAVFVFGYRPGGLEELLRVVPESGSVRESIMDGRLTLTEPVYGPGDPLCCPSQLQTTTYRWDGSQLVVADERTEPGVEN